MTPSDGHAGPVTSGVSDDEASFPSREAAQTGQNHCECQATLRQKITNWFGKVADQTSWVNLKAL